MVQEARGADVANPKEPWALAPTPGQIEPVVLAATEMKLVPIASSIGFLQLTRRTQLDVELATQCKLSAGQEVARYGHERALCLES